MSDLLDLSPPGQLSNDSLAGAKAYFYNAGTTTLRTVYSDSALTVPHPSPLQADADGLFAQVFVSGTAVKVVVTDSADGSLYTLDPAPKVAASAAAASTISFAPTSEIPATDVQAAIEQVQTNFSTTLSTVNIIINGSGRVNQRGYVSGTATSGANEYTLDRWRVVTSGQSLTFTGNNAGRTMTAPAGGVEQVIEGVSIKGGTYIISFTGTATCTVDGVTKASGDTFTLTANTNATVRFSSGTFTDVQVQRGDVVTPFEYLPFADEFARCQRYYQTFPYRARFDVSAGSQVDGRRLPLPVTMRTTPSGSWAASATTNVSSFTAAGVNQYGFSAEALSTASGAVEWAGTLTFDAEI